MGDSQNFHLSEKLSTIQTLVKSTSSYKKDCDCVVLYCNAFEIEPFTSLMKKEKGFRFTLGIVILLA